MDHPIFTLPFDRIRTEREFMRRRFVIAAKLIAAYVVMLAPSTAGAGEGDCNETVGQFTNRDGRSLYRVNYNSLAEIDSPEDEATQVELLHAIVQGAELWGTQASAGYFQYNGITTKQAIVEPDECGIGYSIVVADSQPCSRPAAAHVIERCNGELYEVHICDSSPYSIGDVVPQVNVGLTKEFGFDLPLVMAHEFGHTLGINHSTGANDVEDDINGSFFDDEAAVMRTGGPAGGPAGINTLAGRDLYSYDVMCSKKLGGSRSLSERHRIYRSATDRFRRERSFSGTWPVTQVSPSRNWKIAGTWAGSFTLGEQVASPPGAGLRWTRAINSAQSDYKSVFGTDFHMAPVVGIWRETRPTARVFVSLGWSDYPTQWDAASTHLLMQFFSDDQFVTNPSTVLMREQSVSAEPTFIQTAKRIAVAWDAETRRSVTAWVHSNRSDDVLDHRIRISLGHIFDSLLTIPFPNGMPNTTVAPGLACATGAAVGGHNCVAAYVPLGDRLCQTNADCDPSGLIQCKTSLAVPQCEQTGEVAVFAFTPTLNGDQTLIDFRPPVFVDPLQGKTATDIAAWHSDDEFWIAFRSSNVIDQPILVYRSADGESWTRLVQAIGSTAVPPQASSIWHGRNNILMYAE